MKTSRMMKRNWLAILGASAIVGAAGLGVTQTVTADQNTQTGNTTVAQIGLAAPDFTLTDIEGKEHTLSEYTSQDKIVVLEWFNPMCPFCVRHYKDGAMQKLAESYKDKDVVWIAINSAGEDHPTADVNVNKKRVKEWEIAYPLLFDADGEVGRAYGAKTTPHMFIVDTKGILVYDGAIDDDRSGRNEKTTNYVSNALDQTLAGETVTTSKTRSYGCSVKFAR